MLMTLEEEFEYSPTINNLLDNKTLNWIFVGGKGGVGKTTTACAIAKLLCERGKRVLLISTDPAHNISDALGQKIGEIPTNVKGEKNLDAMEISPKKGLKSLLSHNSDSESGGLLGDLLAAIPGIDEAVSFAELMRQVRDMTHDVIVFDTAPTGHTLKFLGFPTVLEKAIAKLIELRNRFSGVLASVQVAFGAGEASAKNGLSDVLAQLENTKAVVEAVNDQFQDEKLTAFVAVCIPEFLSVFETSRLMKSLGEFKISCETLVVNQVLFPPKESGCGKCLARVKMQRKYLEQINAMFDCSIVTVPLMDDEVRGLESIGKYSRYLCEPYNGE